MSKKYTLGYCIWLLGGVSVTEKVQFVYDQGFRSIAKLQTTDSDKNPDCRDAAQLIRELGMTMTCHTNVQGNLKNRRMDPDFARRALADDAWWNDATGGAVHSCCSDTIATPDPREFLMDDVIALAEMEKAFWSGTNVLSGIENTTACEYSLPEQFAKMAPHSTAMLLDAGHAHIALNTYPQVKGMSMESYIDAIPLTLAEVHISDNHGERDEHLAPQQGTTDYDSLLRGLEKRVETPVISLEFCKDITNGLYAHDLTVPADRDRVICAMNTLKEIFPH